MRAHNSYVIGLKDIFAYGTLAALTFLWFGWLAQFGWDPHHDGILTKPAIDVAHGARVFADTFSQYGAIMIWLQAAIVSIFGESLLAIRLSSVAFLSLAVFFLGLSLVRVVPRPVAFGAVLLWLSTNDALTYVTLPWSSVYLMGLQAIMLYLTLLAFDTRTAKPLLWAAIGGLVGLAVFIRMPQGLMHLIVFVLALGLSPLVRPSLFQFKTNLISLGSFLLGGAVTAGIILYTIVRSGGYDDFVLQIFDMARAFPKIIGLAWYGQDTASGGFFSSFLSDVFPTNFEFIWLLFSVATALAFLWLIAPQRWVTPYHNWPALLAFTTVATAAWSQYFPISEPRHFHWASMAMIGPFTVLALHLIRRRAPHKPVKWVFVFFALLLLDIVPSRIETVSERLSTHTQHIETPELLRGLYTTPKHHAEITEVANALQDLRERFPNRPVIVTGYDPIYVNFVEPVPNWHPVYVSYDIALAVYPNYQRDLANYIRTAEPILVTNGEVPLHLGYQPRLTTYDGLTVAAPGEDPAIMQARYSHFGPVASHLNVERDLLFTQAHWVNPLKNSAAFRTAPLDMEEDFLLEMTLQTARDMRQYETLLFSLFGPHQGRGLTVAGGANPDELLVQFFGHSDSQSVSLNLTRMQFNHLAIQRTGSALKVWLNGDIVGQVKAPEGLGSPVNPLIVGNSIRLQDRFHGKIFAMRVLKGSATTADIQESAANIRQMFDTLTQRKTTADAKDNK